MSDAHLASFIDDICHECDERPRNPGHIWCQQCYVAKRNLRSSYILPQLIGCDTCGFPRVPGSECTRCAMSNIPSEDATYEELQEWENRQNRPDQLTIGIRRSIISLLPVQQIKANNICVICQEDFSSDTKGKILRCGHYYHVDCCDKWLEEKMACPTCNLEVVLD